MLAATIFSDISMKNETKGETYKLSVTKSMNYIKVCKMRITSLHQGDKKHYTAMAIMTVITKQAVRRSTRLRLSSKSRHSRIIFYNRNKDRGRWQLGISS